MKLLHFSDLHLQSNPAPENQFHVQPFWRGETRLLFDRIAALATETDALAFTGDATHGGQQRDAALFFDLITTAAAGKPIFMVLGNHDVVNPAFEAHFHSQAKRYPNIHIADGIYPLGDIDVMLMHAGYITMENLVTPGWSPPIFPVPGLSDASSAMFDALLAKDASRPVLAMTHCPSHILPPTATGFPPYVGPGMEAYRSRVNALLDKHPRVRAMIAGHVHFNSAKIEENGRVHQSIASVAEAPCQVRVVELKNHRFQSRLINLETGTEQSE
jgi:UDP-2,3-diacylglucosamine pyrophosphatase LpxH